MDPLPQPTPTTVVNVDPVKPREEHLFQISPTLEKSRVDLPPVYTSLGPDPSAFPKKLGGVPESEPSPLSLPKGVFDTALRAPAPFADLIWFFKGDSFFRYFESADGDDKVDGIMMDNEGSPQVQGYSRIVLTEYPRGCGR